MRAATYLRVSSDKQARAGTIDSQRREVPARCEREGWPIVREYVDDGASAATGNMANRPGLLAMLADAEARVFDTLVVYDLDRLTRADLLERSLILGTLQRAGVQVATVTGGVLDLGSIAGEITAMVQSRGAADWLVKHRARIKAGKLTAIERGRKPAGPTPYGYRYSREAGLWSVDDRTGPIVVEIFTRIAAGENCADIAADLARRDVPRRRAVGWNRHGVWRIARTETYARGSWVADKARRLSVPVPVIVTPEEYAAAQVALAAHGRRGLRRTRHVYLLEGAATCGLCGAKVHIQSATSHAPSQYVCSQRKTPIGVPCTGPRISTAALDARLWAELVDLVDDDRLAERVARKLRDGSPANDAGAQIARGRLELARVDRAERALVDRADRITPAVLDAQLDRLAAARRAATSLIAAAEAQQRAQRVTIAAVATLDEVLAELRAAVPGASSEERRELAGILLGDVEIGAVALSATVHLPTRRLSLVSGPGYSSSLPERAAAGRLSVALPRRAA